MPAAPVPHAFIAVSTLPSCDRLVSFDAATLVSASCLARAAMLCAWHLLVDAGSVLVLSVWLPAFILAAFGASCCSGSAIRSTFSAFPFLTPIARL